MMKRFVANVLLCCLLASCVLATGTKSAAYIGGTHAEFNQRKGATEGKLDLSDNQALVFAARGASITVPYDRIIAVEYQRAGKYQNRSGNTTVIIVPPVAVAVLPLAARKKHFLTIAYKDPEERAQVIVLELSKEIEKEARAKIAARSGKPINVVTD